MSGGYDNQQQWRRTQDGPGREASERFREAVHHHYLQHGNWQGGGGYIHRPHHPHAHPTHLEMTDPYAPHHHHPYHAHHRHPYQQAETSEAPYTNHHGRQAEYGNPGREPFSLPRAHDRSLIAEATRNQRPRDATGCVRAFARTMENQFGFTPHGDAYNCFWDTWNHLKSGKYGHYQLVHIDGLSPGTSLQPNDIAAMPWSPGRAAKEGGRNCGHIWVQGYGGNQIAQGTWSIDSTKWGNYDPSRMFAIRRVS